MKAENSKLRVSLMQFFMDYSYVIGALAGVAVIIASVFSHLGDNRESAEAARRQADIIELQAKLQSETQEVSIRQDTIISLQAELREASEKSVGYLRGDDSHIYLAYQDLNRVNQHVNLIQVGPNPVWDITVQAYPLSRFPTRNELTVAEQASALFRYEDPVLHEGRVTKLVQFPTPNPDDASTWDRYVELFTRSGAYSELLLLHYVNGVWSQGHVVYFARKDGRAGIMESQFDDNFPQNRRERVEALVAETVAKAGN